ncbi:hypothetical protein [Microbacterium memoriense]|uniref:ABC-2 type transport system permease protein n=1 Tax=Microbacterium memoriense TaxID=2978350 RepID=A0ABT2PBC6_9MICO|nr:hypothetical protein [Microbacterium memoriense]MCT9001905.1 hypothetical protein [Microbacterium memoriense]
MVATVLRLRYRILGNTLASRPWQLVGFCFGIVGALSLLALAVATFVGVAVADSVDLSRVVVVVGGSALLLGWLLGPLLIAGTESTIDAERLAPFPLTTAQVMRALAATGLTGVPGIVTTLASLATVIVWIAWPAAALVAVPAALVGVVTCVVATRLMVALSAGLGGSRRGRELIGTVVLAVLIMTGPILTGVLALISGTNDLGSRFAQAAAVLSWTPLGAAWAVPADIATGDVLTAAAKAVIALATLVVVWLLWARALERSTSAPGRPATRAAKPGALGLFGWMPTGGIGATWARSLTAWTRDPRYLRQLLVVPLFPVLFAFTSGLDGAMFVSSAVIVAFVIAIAGYADISYDGTAYASVLATGIPGAADRLGRALGSASIGIPLTLVTAVVTTTLAGALEHLPAVVGAALGILLTGYGVTAVSSALVIAPVPAPGDSPFKSVPGQTFVGGLLVFLVWGACMLLAAPSIVLAILSAAVGQPVLGWVALASGVLVGGGMAAAGVVIGGRTLDRTGPDLLRKIKALPTS